MKKGKEIKEFKFDDALTKRFVRGIRKCANTGDMCIYLNRQSWFKTSGGLTAIDFIRLNNSFGAGFGIGVCDGELKPILMETERR